MAKQVKGLIAIVSIAMLIYLIPSANTLVANDSKNDDQDKFAGATISVEASLAVVEFEALEEIVDELDINSLSSIPVEKIMQCVREDEGGELVSIVQLAVRNMSSGEMSREERVKEQRKVSDEDVSEHEEGENHISFSVVPEIIDNHRIAVSFNFKQISNEGALTSTSDSEEQEERDVVIEVSSNVVLLPGQKKIVSVTKQDEAFFLIMSVGI
jgi:hypothetical protein